MAIHPLGILDWENGEADRRTIRANIEELRRLGPDLWVGYSYAWLGSLHARAQDGNSAAEALRIFADCFCLKNSFHANGDQSHTGKSRFTYRPFTLEGNFAFAAGIQEMLLQSHAGQMRVFPAIPTSWQAVSFSTLRAEGAFLVSATMAKGAVVTLRIRAEEGGLARIANPFGTRQWDESGIEKERVRREGTLLLIQMERGTEVLLTAHEAE